MTEIMKKITLLTVLLAVVASLSAQRTDTTSAEYFYNRGLAYYYGGGCSQNIDSTIFYWSKAAEKGSKNAAYGLGLIYEDGTLVDQDSKQAFKWFSRAAQLGDMFAQYTMGLYLCNGYVGQPDATEAIAWLKKAANQNYAPAMRQIGIILEARTDPKDSTYKQYKPIMNWYAKAAAQKDAVAQYRLGNLYFEGKGDYHNLPKAYALYKKAANGGCVEAMYAAGICEVFGYGVEHDGRKGMAWIRKAAELGMPDAQYLLGVSYAYGDYVKKNLDSALYYLIPLSQQGFDEAYYDLGLIYYNEYKDVDKALQCWQKADSLQVEEVYYALGVLYYVGMGVERSLDQAYEYWTKGAANDCHCQHGLGIMYYTGVPVRQDYKKAYAYFEKAVKGCGYPYAFYMLGVCCENGQGCSRDVSLALQNYGAAADAGHLESMVSFVSLRNYAGITMYDDQAQEYLELALKAGYQPAIDYQRNIMEHKDQLKAERRHAHRAAEGLEISADNHAAPTPVRRKH